MAPRQYVPRIPPHDLANTNPVPSYATIKPGETVKIECVDWTGGQIGNNDSADDMRVRHPYNPT